jgi:alanine dehydrogenase
VEVITMKSELIGMCLQFQFYIVDVAVDDGNCAEADEHCGHTQDVSGNCDPAIFHVASR